LTKILDEGLSAAAASFAAKVGTRDVRVGEPTMFARIGMLPAAAPIKIQFNGLGGLRPYIGFTRIGDRSPS
jgi:hypothetical protein